MTGFTQIPNWIFDEMAEMNASTLQVVLLVCRKTIGYANGSGGRKEWDRISLSQFSAGTNLSRQGSINAVNDAMDRGYIERRELGQYFEYKLVNSVDRKNTKLVNSVDQSSQLTSQVSRPVVVNSVDQLDAKLVNSVDTQNKEIKEKNKSSDDSYSSDRDGKYLIEIVRFAGFMYLDAQATRIAMELESDYSDAQLREALGKTVEAHQKQIKTGGRGITAPLAYMRQVLLGMDTSPVAAKNGNGNGTSFVLPKAMALFTGSEK